MPQITLIVANSTQPRRLNSLLPIRRRPATTRLDDRCLAVLNALAPYSRTVPRPGPGTARTARTVARACVLARAPRPASWLAQLFVTGCSPIAPGLLPRHHSTRLHHHTVTVSGDQIFRPHISPARLRSEPRRGQASSVCGQRYNPTHIPNGPTWTQTPPPEPGPRVRGHDQAAVRTTPRPGQQRPWPALQPDAHSERADL